MNWNVLQFPPPQWPGGRYSFLLGTLVLMLAADPLMRPFWLGQFVLDVFAAVVLVSALLALGNRKVVLIIAAAIAVPELLAIAAAWVFDKHGSLGAGPGGIMRSITAILFFGYMIVIVMSDVLRGRSTTSEKICGATSVYLMLGLVWAFAFLIIEQHSPGSIQFGDQFARASASGQSGELFALLTYFSFVTLTTVGYGDISPVSPIARTGCWLEAIAGQLFLATFLAGLVGIHVSRGRRELKE